MASDTLVGIEGYIIFPSGISGWFQFQLNPSDFQDIAPWATAPLQRNICAFELLGQCLLLQVLNGAHQHCTLTTACDNTASEVATTKATSGSIGISCILPQFFRYQLRYDFFQQVQRIPQVTLSCWFGLVVWVFLITLYFDQKRKALIILKNDQKSVRTLSLKL